MSGGALGACGVAAVVFVLVYKGVRTKSWHIEVQAIPVAFLAGMVFPYGLAMLAFPFSDHPPSLESLKPYMPLTGLVLLWAGYMGIKQAVDAAAQRAGSSASEPRNVEQIRRSQGSDGDEQ